LEYVGYNALRTMRAKPLLLILSLFSALIWLTVFSFPDNKLHLIFCDVGQGDATLITKGFNQILIDGGPNDKVLSCLAQNMPFFDRTIEVVALTHPEADHLTGLLSVLDKYKVDNFFSGPEVNNSAIAIALVEKLKVKEKNEGLRLKSLFTGEKIVLGDISLETLWPEKNWARQKLSNIAANKNLTFISNQVLGMQVGNLKLNQFSLVFLLNYQKINVLLMGDADSSVENDVTLPSSLISLDILKFPHHGSKTGITEDFLAKIKPKEAVISVGKNSYGHPTTEALDLLKKYNVRIRRTDLEGDIRYKF